MRTIITFDVELCHNCRICYWIRNFESFLGGFLSAEMFKQHFKGYFAKVVELLGSGNSHVAARIKYSKVRQNTGVSETLVEL